VNRLRALFVGAGALVVAGVVITLGVLRPGVTLSEAIDAGLLAYSVPARLRCNLQVHPDCRTLPDGGELRPYVRAQLRARRIPGPDGGMEDGFVVTDVPDRADGGFCVRLVGTADEACDLLEASSCTVPAVCGQAWPVIEQQLCACRRATGNCWTSDLPDGGSPYQAPMGVTISAGRWQGPGCQRKYCGPILLGDEDDWPAECPQG
jgi:hypothetical protein